MQLVDGIGPQAGEHQVAVDTQRTLPAVDQSFGIGHLVQQHVGPEHADAGFGRNLEAQFAARPASGLPPAPAQLLPGQAGPCGFGFVDRAGGLGIVLAQQLMGLQAAAHRLPMAPVLGRLDDPLQPLLHAACHLLMQPRGCCGRHALPAGGGLGVDSRRQGMRHEGNKAGKPRKAPDPRSTADDKARRASILIP